jgi:two-component system cell cycle sensor histidine kinase PleC
MLGDKALFTTAVASTGKGLVHDVGLLARSIAPVDDVFAATGTVWTIVAVAAGVGALLALYLAWRWTTPLVQLAQAMNRLARGDTDWSIPAFSRSSPFAEVARALEAFRQTRIVRDRVAAREQELHSANQDALAAARAKSEHLASLSREIRTQLTTIIGMSEMINKESLAAATTTPNAANAKYIGYAKDIGRSGVQLLAVINDLFDLSEAEAGHLKLDEAAIDLGLLAQESADMMRDAAQKAKLALICDLPEMPIVARADAHKLKQALFNLLSNAIKFTPADGFVRIGVRVMSGGRPAITVIDNGIGMHPNLTPVAMIPFTNSDGSNHGRHGAGFGLPLVRQLVELHDGTVEIESEIGKGTTVAVILPAERLIDGGVKQPALQVA